VLPSKVTAVSVLMRERKGSNSTQKNQLLFESFGINYNDVPERMRKGSVVVREEVWDSLYSEYPFLLTLAGKVVKEGDPSDVENKGKGKRRRGLMQVTVLHCDLIRDEFWKERPHIVSG